MQAADTFLKTISLTPDIKYAVANGGLNLKRGQWVFDPGTGRKGQYIGKRGTVVYVSWKTRGESFTNRTTRFARAVHNHKDHPDLRELIQSAPDTQRVPQLKKLAGYVK